MATGSLKSYCLFCFVTLWKPNVLEINKKKQMRSQLIPIVYRGNLTSSKNLSWRLWNSSGTHWKHVAVDKRGCKFVEHCFMVRGIRVSWLWVCKYTQQSYLDWKKPGYIIDKIQSRWGFIKDKYSGPYLLRQTMNGSRCLEMLRNYVWPIVFEQKGLERMISCKLKHRPAFTYTFELGLK